MAATSFPPRSSISAAAAGMVVPSVSHVTTRRVASAVALAPLLRFCFPKVMPFMAGLQKIGEHSVTSFDQKIGSQIVPVIIL